MSKSLLLRFLAALAALSLVAAACGDDDDATDATESGASEDGTASATDAEPGDDADADDAAGDTGDDAADSESDEEAAEEAEEVDNTDLGVKPVITIPDDDPPTELVTTDIVVGTGPVAEAGDFAIMQYVGVSYSNGEQFDASWDRGQPFTFALGEGQVIQGWDDGIVGMAAGGRRQLVIPPDQAYGEAGSGSGSIGPNETLVFIVDLIGVVPADAEKPTVVVPDAPATELQVTDTVEGNGAEVEAGSIVWVHYVGVAQSTGEQFDASWDRGTKAVVPFQVGVGQVIPGWDEGLLGMKVGGQRELIIPPDLAYGEAGAGDGVIAPGETLVFVIDLVGVA